MQITRVRYLHIAKFSDDPHPLPGQTFQSWNSSKKLKYNGSADIGHYTWPDRAIAHCAAAEKIGKPEQSAAYLPGYFGYQILETAALTLESEQY